MKTTRLTSDLRWTTASGYSLLSVREGGKEAMILANVLNADGLRALADAALDAAQHLADSELSMAELVEQRR
ncbi:hypothetical protein [Lacipirellula sp.]|uniref:hypothetical protein n=1 Tax=Lacipirellula sp. TaxID=2691419 RepID=UPI003D14F67D